MGRIDARFGRQAGVNPVSITPERDRSIEDLGRGVEAVGAALQERRQFNARVDRIREREADDLALADLTSRTTIALNKRLDEEADKYDGAEGGFADRIAETFRQETDKMIAAEPPRRQKEARLALTGLNQRLALAAYDIEDGRRASYTLTEAGRQAAADANATRLDPAFHATAIENHERRKMALPVNLRADYDENRRAIDFAYGEARIDADPQGFLQELKAGALSSLDPAVHGRLTNAATAEIERRARQAKADARAAMADAKAAAKQEIANIDAAIDAGLPVDPARLANVAAAAAGAGPDVAQDIQERADVLRAVSYIQRAPFADAEAEIAAERARIAAKGDASGLEARRLAAVEKAAGASRRRASQDFAGFAADAFPDRVQPLDVDNLTPQALSARASAIDAAAEYFGADAEKAYLTDHERASLARRFIEDPKGAVETASVIAALPQGRRVLSEIAPKAPELAHLGGLLAQGGDGQFIDDAAQGAALARQTGFKARVTPSVASEFHAELAPAFALFPDSAQAAARSASMALEARALRNGWTADDFNTNAAAMSAKERAIQEAAGGRFDRRGKLFGGVEDYSAFGRSGRALTPSWLENGKLRTTIARAIPADYGGAFDADGNAVRPEIVRKAFPVAVGDGKYFLALGDPYGDPEWLLDAKGDELVLDLTKIRDRLENRPAPPAAQKQGQGGQ